MRKYLIIITLFASSLSYSNTYSPIDDIENFIIDSKKTWNNLSVIVINQSFAIIYNPDIASNLLDNNKKIFYSFNNKDLIENKGILLFTDKDNNSVVIKYFQGYPLGASLYIEGNSLDFSYQENEIKVICIPDNSNLYILKSGGHPKTFQRTKLICKDKKYYETEQEFYYIGKYSIANSDLKMVTNKNSEIEIIKSGNELFVIGIKRDLVLVKSTIGIVGWIKIEYIKSKYEIDGFEYRTANISFFNDVLY